MKNKKRKLKKRMKNGKLTLFKKQRNWPFVNNEEKMKTRKTYKKLFKTKTKKNKRKNERGKT